MVDVNPMFSYDTDHKDQPVSSRTAIILLVVTSFIMFSASLGTWLTGRYQIVQLDDLKDRYWTPVKDYGATFSAAAAQPKTLERDVLEGCKQSQVGTWLQTTDSLAFIDPIAGNKILVKLDPARAFVELNGRDLSSCVQDEIETLQYDIRSQTSSWSVLLLVLGVITAAWSAYLAWFARRPGKGELDEAGKYINDDMASVPATITPEKGDKTENV